MPIELVGYKNGSFQKLTNLGGGSYDGEKQMGDLDQMWTYHPEANDFVRNTYNLLLERSATLYHTYPLVRGGINKLVNYAIGPGLVFRSQPDFRMLGISKDEAVELGKRIQRVVHYYFSNLGFYEKQSILFRSALYGGDSLLFFDRDSDGTLVDLIEAGGEHIDANKYDNKKYTLGIKHDSMLRREAIVKADGKEVAFQNKAGDQNVVQFYLKELPRQLRGYPLAYSIINLARNDDTHTDAITQRAVIESIIMAASKTSGTDLRQQAKQLGERNKERKQQSSGRTLFSRVANAVKLGAGNIFQLKTGEDFNFLDMKAPGDNFDPYKQQILKYASMAMDIPPEVVKSEYSTSFTAHKGAFNDFQKGYMKKRRTFERKVMSVVVREVVKDAILQGFIDAPGFFDGGKMIQQAYLSGMYLGPVPNHINPLVEVKADVEKVKNAFDLRSDMAEKAGHDWDVFIEEWKQEQDEFTSAPQEHQAREIYNQETQND